MNSNILLLKTGEEIYEKKISELYKSKKLHVIPGLLKVEHFSKKAPFADYSNLAILKISYKTLKNIDILKLLENIDLTIIFSVPRKPDLLIKKIIDRYPNSILLGNTLTVSKPDTALRWDRFTFVKTLPGKEQMEEYTVVIKNKKYKVLSSFDITENTPIVQLKKTDKPGYDYEIEFWSTI
jgi:hypothetical protein